MPVRIPPIAALRAVEAASRHLSFTRAAEELFVTQSAISHQIRHAEDLWNFKLFERRGRRLLLTAEGREIIPVIRDFIVKISSTVEALQQADSVQALRVTLLATFAFKWLVPKLGNFNKRHPDTDIWLSTTEEMVDFNRSNADVGIRLGPGDWDNVFNELLLREFVFPVCSPAFLEEHGEPADIEQLLHYPLLRRSTVDICPRWKDWFRDAGIELTLMAHGTKFPGSSYAIQAAIDHQGVALARSVHVLDDLKTGRLIHLFPEVISRSPLGYYFVCAPGRQDEPQVAAFRAWLNDEAKVSQREIDTEVAPAG